MSKLLTEAGLKVGLDFSEPSGLSQSHPYLLERQSFDVSLASHALEFLCLESSSELQPVLIPERTPLQTRGNHPDSRRKDTRRLQERDALARDPGLRF